MSSRFGAAFSATLALLLLALYCSSALYLIYEVYTTNKTTLDKPQGYIYVLTTVGGLVSALVIAQLSVTKPGSAPSIGGARPESTLGIYATNTVVGFYLFAWAFTGLAALIVGVMLKPEVNKTIADLGTTWLGLAVTAAYAYFGIQPSGNVNERPDDSKPQQATDVGAQLQQKIDERRITFEPGKPRLQEQLLRTNSGPVIAPKLQSLVLALATLSPDPIQISELPLASDDADAGRAVTIGNEAIANRLLPLVATAEQVPKLGIDKIIFDASVTDQANRNVWNYRAGAQYSYDEDTLGAHRTDIYFAVTA